MQDFNFTKGFIWSFLGFGIPLLILQSILVLSGELSLDYVVSRQLSDPIKLFSSGINQNAYNYKLALLSKVRPEIIVIGSSRSMQVRKEFFRKKFVNLGGAVSNVSDLEAFANDIKAKQNHPELILLFIDPWWFNKRYPSASELHSSAEFPGVINMDVIINAINLFSAGNWLKATWNSPNLGIHSLLTNEGFSQDGSYHYTSTITGKVKSVDANFVNTINRIDGDKQRFEKAETADAILLERTCNAIRKMKTVTHNIVLIAPPFASPVWSKMEGRGYHYISDAYKKISICSGESLFLDYSNPATISANDCEFVDGFHGGDTVSARMLEHASLKSTELGEVIDSHYIKDFLTRFNGHAAGLTMIRDPKVKEVDFLNLGCWK